MPRYAAQERAALAATLDGSGPDAPTLCAGWATRDLAAHLVLRERTLLPAMGIVLPPLAGVTGRTQQRLADGDYPALVDAVRRGPRLGPARIGGVHEAMNLVEFFVHHEDVLRAAPGWSARELEAGYQAALWRRVPLLARARLLRLGATASVRAPGLGAVRAGRGQPAVTLVGRPAELVLLLFGRGRAAEVETDGPAEVVERLLAA